MSLKVNYKGAQIAQLSDDGELTLKTAGKYCEDDIGVVYTSDKDPTHSVTQNLTDVSSSADETKVIDGNSFFTELIPDDGYVISSITVTMGGVDITNQVFKPGTGTKVITANGTYTAEDDDVSGYSSVVVNVQSGISTYSITQNLTDVSSTNISGEVLVGGSLYIELEPTIEDYSISEITVTMGGVDITDQVFKSGGN